MDLKNQKKTMVNDHLLGRGLTAPRILDAFAQVAREEFVPPELRDWTYADRPLDIGSGQTISQPYIVALTVDKLNLSFTDKVLEIGTGSGYAAAILAKLAGTVFTLERLPELARQASERLSRLKYSNVTVICADGTRGYPSQAPYNAIAVAAAGPRVPASLKQQLAVGGRLVIPVGDSNEQLLTRITRTDDQDFLEETLCKVRFVPLLGEQGWSVGQL